MYYTLLIIIALIVLGFIYFNYSGKKEHYVNRYSGVNQCGELDPGPFDRPKQKPSCFAYRVNHVNEMLNNSLDRVAKGLDSEITRSNRIDDRFYQLALSNENRIKALMDGDLVKGVQTNLGSGANLLNASKRTNLIDPKLLEVYNLNNAETEDIIRTAIEQHVASVLDATMAESGINFNDAVSKVITEDVRNKVVSPIISMIYNTVNRNLGKDINAIINEIVQKADIDTQINNLVSIGINNDKRIRTYLDASKANQLRIGDFVYFKTTLDKPVEQICADSPQYQEIIVGGRVCSIDPVARVASISYNIIINPNKNPRCQGLASTNPAVIDYDKGVDGIPKWYPMSSMNNESCGFGLPDKLACKPSQWNDSSDNWVNEWIGGFDRKTDTMACGVSPKNFNLPEKIPIANLNKSLEKVLMSCKSDYKVDSQMAQPIQVSVSSGEQQLQQSGLGFTPPPVQSQNIQQNKCDDRCLSFIKDNNKPDRMIKLSNGNKYYIKNDMLYKDNNSYPMVSGVVPEYVFKRADQNTIFILGSDKKYYKLSKTGIVPLDNIDMDSYGGNPDSSGCCFR